ASSVPACVPFGCGSCGSPLEPRSTRVLIRCTSMPCRRAREPGAFAFHGFRCRTTLILADYTDSFRIGLRTAGDEWETGPLLAVGGAAGPRRPFARRDACRLCRTARRPPPSSHGATPAAFVARRNARRPRRTAQRPPPSSHGATPAAFVARRNVGLVRGGGIGPDCPGAVAALAARSSHGGRTVDARSSPGRRPVGHGGCRWPGYGTTRPAASGVRCSLSPAGLARQATSSLRLFEATTAPAPAGPCSPGRRR